MHGMEESDSNPNIIGLSTGVNAMAKAFGTVMLAIKDGDKTVFVCIEDVLYVPSAGCNLFSPGLAIDQGFNMTWDNTANTFGIVKDKIPLCRTVFHNRLWTFDAHHVDTPVPQSKMVARNQVFVNFAVTDGVADINVWHERLGHTCS